MSTVPITPPTSARSEHKQFTINVVSNVVVFATTFVLNLWFVPFLIHRLGVAVYGVIPLAASVTSYMSLLTLSFQEAASRFLTIEYNKRNFVKANHLFNTALLTALFLISIAIPISILIVILAPRVFNIPEGENRAAQLLFGTILLAFIINAVDGVFSLSSWVRNRFDLRNAIQFSNNIIRVLFVVIVFEVLGANLAVVGIGIFLATIVTLLGDVWLWRYLTPELTLRVQNARWQDVSEITQMSGWMLVNQVGSLLFLNIDLFVINWIVGAEASGSYGALLQVSVYVRTFANLVVTAAIPLVTIQYAHQNWEQLRHRMKQAVKLMGLIIALPIGFLAGFSQPFLSLWLGKEFTEYSLVLTVMVIHLSVNLAVRPLFPVQIAYNKVKIPGLVTLFSGIVNLVLAIILVDSFGVIGAPLAGMIVLTLKNLIFTPIYVAYIMKIPLTAFFKELGLSALSTITVALLAFSTSKLTNMETWPVIFIGAAALSLLYLVGVYFIALNEDDRQFLARMVPWPTLRKIPGT